ncbi:MAG: sugar phosphate isomerase/epimerase [Planctomycetaceae bacterium]|nr:sugar phosphate isomerase/epimerase [Planctomycetaceae bacterium]
MMHRLRIAIATAPLELPIRKAIDVATEAGVQGVQFDLREEVRPEDFGPTARRQLLHYLDERNLRVGPATFGLRRPLFDPEYVEARLEALKTAMTFAWDLGARALTLRVGDPLPNPENASASELTRQILEELAAHANQVGVVPTLIPSGDGAGRIVELIQSIKVGPLAVEADPFTAVACRYNFSDWLRELHQHVQHVRIRDGIRESFGGGKEVALGRGEVDWNEVIASVHEIEYQGWITVAGRPGADTATDTFRAATFVRNLLVLG